MGIFMGQNQWISQSMAISGGMWLKSVDFGVPHLPQEWSITTTNMEDDLPKKSIFFGASIFPFLFRLAGSHIFPCHPMSGASNFPFPHGQNGRNIGAVA